MYNRYVPQSDGSYRRNRMEESRPDQQPQRRPEPQRKPEPQCKPEPPCPQPPQACEKSHLDERRHQGQNVLGFLKQLLPKDFDTADLIIVLLLVLLAGDSEEDKSTAMLTLVLYLFM